MNQYNNRMGCMQNYLVFVSALELFACACFAQFWPQLLCACYIVCMLNFSKCCIYVIMNRDALKKENVHCKEWLSTHLWWNLRKFIFDHNRKENLQRAMCSQRICYYYWWFSLLVFRKNAMKKSICSFVAQISTTKNEQGTLSYCTHYYHKMFKTHTNLAHMKVQEQKYIRI